MKQRTDPLVKLMLRNRKIDERQDRYRWGPAYEPGCQNIQGEAPSKSNVGNFYSAKLQRHMHWFSKTEQWACAIALYHDRVWEVHEQHVLYPDATPHPLATHPKTRAFRWAGTTGTLAIADRLNLIKWYPTILDREANDYVPAHLLGDALIYLEDQEGPYVVSWDCKASADQHGRPGPSSWRAQHSPRSIRKAETRERLYQAYMEEQGIRIVRISRFDIDENVRCNLVRLANLHSQPISIPDEMFAELTQCYSEALASGEVPLAAMRRVCPKTEQQREAKKVLDQMVWERRLKVDLFEPVHIDKPLNPERRDVLEVYVNLFSRK